MERISVKQYKSVVFSYSIFKLFKVNEIREKIQVDEEAVPEVGDTEENVESEVIQKVSEINKPTTQQEEKDDWGVLNFLKWQEHHLM